MLGQDIDIEAVPNRLKIISVKVICLILYIVKKGTVVYFQIENVQQYGGEPIQQYGGEPNLELWKYTQPRDYTGQIKGHGKGIGKYQTFFRNFFKSEENKFESGQK